MQLPRGWLLIVGITAGIAACAISAVDQQLRAAMFWPPADHLWLVIIGDGQIKIELLGVKLTIDCAGIYSAISAGGIKVLDILTHWKDIFTQWVSKIITN